MVRLCNSFISTEHELSCLIYEEALRRGLDTNQGQADDGYFVEVFDCTLVEFATILLTVGQQQSVNLQPG